MKTVTIKQEYLEMIKDGKKTLEIRVGYPNILSTHIQDQLLLVSGPERQVVIVKDIRKYNAFETMLEKEDYNKVIPGLSKEDVLRKLKEIYPHEKESLGVIVIDIQTISPKRGEQ